MSFHRLSALNIRQLLLLSLLLFLGLKAEAGSLYLPLQLSPEIEGRVERLFIVANMPIIKRPIPIKRVQEAIGKASKKDPRLAMSVKNYIDRYSKTAGFGHFNLSASYSEGAELIQPNRRGATTRSSYEVSSSAYWVVSDLIAINLGGFASEGPDGRKDTFAEGSFISIGWDYFQTDIGFRPHWWGPFQESDMLLSSNAAALPSITFSNVKPLPFLNMSYEIFLGEMSESDEILSASRNERLTGNPLLFGTHISFNPVEGMAIGFNRILQFGGADRDKNPSSVFDAYFNASENDNIGIAGNDFGNQVSSITARYTFSGEFPVSVYMQYAGEDSSLPSEAHQGNSALMFGLHLPKLTNSLDLTLETAEWQNGWYTNTNYNSGQTNHLSLTNHQSVIGHWGGNYKSTDKDLGATAYTAKLIWDISDGQSLTLKYNELKNTTIQASEFEASRIASAEYARATGKFISGIKLSSGNDIRGESFNQVSVFLRW